MLGRHGAVRVLAINDDLNYLKSIFVTESGKLVHLTKPAVVEETIDDKNIIKKLKLEQVASIDEPNIIKQEQDEQEVVVSNNNVMDMEWNAKDFEDLITIDDDDSSDLEQEESDDSDAEFSKEHVKAMAMAVPMKVTKEVIDHQRLWLAVLKYAYKMQNEEVKNELHESFMIPAKYYAPGENMREISPQCGFFFPIDKISYIESMMPGNIPDWSVIVREALSFVYGNELKHYSATGLRSKRPPIDKKLFCGLLDWCNRLSRFHVEKKAFIHYVNKCSDPKDHR
ncbi:uncharacterized protein LOC113389555 [Ctenocephalides felis]|uniref:uncharacterized protein LOC113389555 n=1 Tax=Ctenocephalides felis TaxID=7515 RepID=UPI000E6E149E|nr:uncharacterized protein LOC113389555 [Ctenocephalides felis]